MYLWKMYRLVLVPHVIRPTVSPGLVGQIPKKWVHHKVIATSDRQLYAPQCLGCQKRVAKNFIFHSFHKASRKTLGGFLKWGYPSPRF